MNKQDQLAKLQSVLSALDAIDDWQNFDQAVRGDRSDLDAYNALLDKARAADQAVRSDVSAKKAKVYKAIEFLENQINLEYCLALEV